MKKTIQNYKIRLFLIRFFIIGISSYVVETFFTGTVQFIRTIVFCIRTPDCVFDINKATQGHVGIFAFFIYCWAAIPFTLFTAPLKSRINDDLLIPKLGIILRGVIYGLVFMCIEFVFGIILLAFNIRAWDYRELPLNVLGVITFVYLPSWTIAGIIGEWFHERLLQINEILLNPHGYTPEKINIAYKKYYRQKEKERKAREKKRKLLLEKLKKL